MTLQHIVRILTLVCILVLAQVAIGSIAEARDSRDRSDDRGQETMLAPSPAPSPSPIHIPNTSSPGSITSSTDADVNTGDNTGGKVTTGDESATEFEVNVGPTNPSPPPPLPSPTPTPQPEPDCSTDRRSSSCPPDPDSRTR